MTPFGNLVRRSSRRKGFGPQFVVAALRHEGSFGQFWRAGYGVRRKVAEDYS